MNTIKKAQKINYILTYIRIDEPLIVDRIGILISGD